jgi:hypothetical protein
VLVQGEQKAEFEALAEAYYRDLQPEGALEQLLVGEIIEYELWRRRFASIEAGLLAFGIPLIEETFLDALFGKKEDSTDNQDGDSPGEQAAANTQLDLK